MFRWSFGRVFGRLEEKQASNKAVFACRLRYIRTLQFSPCDYVKVWICKTCLQECMTLSKLYDHGFPDFFDSLKLDFSKGNRFKQPARQRKIILNPDH